MARPRYKQRNHAKTLLAKPTPIPHFMQRRRTARCTVVAKRTDAERYDAHHSVCVCVREREIMCVCVKGEDLRGSNE